MNPQRPRHVLGQQLPAAMLVSLLFASPAAATWRTEAGERWLRGDETLVLLAESAGIAERQRRLRFFIGTHDVSALARIAAADGRVEIAPSVRPWPTGEREIVVYDGGDWSELARLPLRVLSSGGFEKSDWTPKLDVRLDTRPAATRSDGQPVAGRGTYADSAGNAALAWSGALAPWEFEAAANAIGSTDTAKALRFAQLGARAPRLDLADYRVAAALGDQRIEVGHLAGRTHPLLVQDLARRGVALHGKLGEAADVSLHVVHTTATAGWDDPFGVRDAEQRTRLLSLGAELVPGRAGALRAEVGVLDAKTVATSGFDTGSVPDAEHSRGIGLRLTSRSDDERWQAELAFARSRFVNPFDPLLAQGEATTAVRPVTRNAWSAELQAQLVKAAAPAEGTETGAGGSFGLRLLLRHDHAAPLYRSLLDPLQGDQAVSRVGLQAALAGASAQVALSRKFDNLDRIATLLRTRTDETLAALNLPFGRWLAGGDADAATRWPTVSWNWHRVHQFAVSMPPPEDSGFAASQRPDQVNLVQRLQAAWAHGQHGFAYALERTLLDNRQPGRERADFQTLGHQVSATRQFSPTLRANAMLQRQRRLHVETGLVRWTTGGTLGVDWAPDERWTLSSSASLQLGRDSQQLSAARQHAWQAQLARRFDLPGLDRPLPAQVYLRLGRQSERSAERALGLSGGHRSVWLDVGISAGFF